MKHLYAIITSVAGMLTLATSCSVNEMDTYENDPAITCLPVYEAREHRCVPSCLFPIHYCHEADAFEFLSHCLFLLFKSLEIIGKPERWNRPGFHFFFQNGHTPKKLFGRLISNISTWHSSPSKTFEASIIEIS